MRRNCEICSSDRKKYIYTPSFFLPGRAGPFEYNVVLCQSCGFLFADNIPSQKEYEAFYKSNSKYTYNKNIPSGLKKIYHDIFLCGSSFLTKNNPELDKGRFKIIDIGCSIGYILKLFKDAGFKNLIGIEPSFNCIAIAEELYGIKVINCTLSGFENREKFDLIIMTGILEHICGLNETLCKVSLLLNKNGLLMIAVPDVNKFNKNPHVPFDEFSLEHINYFNRSTLFNLLSNHYFENIYSKTVDAEFYDSKLVLSFFRKVEKKEKMKRDNDGYSAIKRYITASKKKLEVIDKNISYLIRSGSEVIVWGAGSLTARLLTSTDLLKANIKFFVDSNKTLQGKRMANIRILPPSIFRKLSNNYKVFISSYIYGKEMRGILLNKYNFRGDIITL